VGLLARGKKCSKHSGAQVDFQSFAEHDLQESDDKPKSMKSRAKDLAKDESCQGTMTRKTINRQWRRHHLEFIGLPGTQNPSKEKNVMA
jgi:hypothetical protein